MFGNEKRKNDQISGGLSLTGCGFIALVVIAVILCGGGSWALGVYNGAVQLDVQVDQAWAQVGNVLQRRLDLYSALEPAITAASAQEREVFQTLAQQSAVLRQYVGQPPSTEQEANRLEQALAGFNRSLAQVASFVADNPDEVGFISLYQDFLVQAEGSENRISVERGRYNNVVAAAQTHCRTFPNLLICNFGNFNWVMFEPSAEAETVPNLTFGQGQ